MAVRVAVVGAGGHGAVVADALVAMGHIVECFLEADAAKFGTSRLKFPVVDERAFRTNARERIALANGVGGVRGTTARRRVQEEWEAEGWSFVTVRHPSAIVSDYAVVCETAQVLAGSVVQAGSAIGRGAIVNTRSLIEHDCLVGEWAHVGPGAIVCGDVKVGDGAHVGAGATIIQGRSLGAGSVLGAGAVLTRNFDGRGTLVGVPAKAIGELP